MATDLDGTLLRGDGTVSPRTAAVLVALEEAGVRVVMVTGRPLRWMDDLWRYVGAHGVALVSNGALAWDARAGRVLEVAALPDRAVRACVAEVRRRVPGTTFALERLSGFSREPDFGGRGVAPGPVPVAASPPVGAAGRAAGPGGVAGAVAPAATGTGGAPRVAPLEALLDADPADGADPVVKLLARHEALAPDDFWRRVEDVVGDRLTATRSATTSLVELSAAGVTKASALARLCADLGVAAADVVAFGDMPNDVPMLAWAGRSWAMAGAHPAVVAAAGASAPGCDEDGVAQVLEGLLALPHP